MMINIKEFGKLELRVGTIESANPFPEAKKQAYKLRIDFGPHGKKWSSAQITTHYSLEELPGRRIIAATNLGDKKIGSFTSQVLVLGAQDEKGNVILLEPDGEIPNGAKVS